MNMLKLVFNTKTKEAKALQGETIIFVFQNVPTVKPNDGYYEVMQEENDPVVGNKRFPVARLPIANTIMLIEK